MTNADRARPRSRPRPPAPAHPCPRPPEWRNRGEIVTKSCRSRNEIVAKSLYIRYDTHTRSTGGAIGFFILGMGGAFVHEETFSGHDVYFFTLPLSPPYRFTFPSEPEDSCFLARSRPTREISFFRFALGGTARSGAEIPPVGAEMPTTGQEPRMSNTRMGNRDQRGEKNTMT